MHLLHPKLEKTENIFRLQARIINLKEIGEKKE